MTGKSDLEAKIKQLRKKLEELNKSYQEDEALLDSIPVLRGEAAKQFEEYNNRPRTEEEIEYMKKAEECYLLCDVEETTKRKNERIARGILTDRYDDIIISKVMKVTRGKISGEMIQFILETTKSTIIDDVMKNIDILHEMNP